MLYDQSLFPTSRLSPGTADGFAILQAGGYVRSVGQGLIAISSLGAAFLQRFAAQLRDQFERYGFSEIALPLLQRSELWEESGRYAKYGSVLAETILGEDTRRFVINPTQEEAVLDLFRTLGIHHQQLPFRCFQIGERVRNEPRPAHGLIRSRSFSLADAYVLSENEASNREEMRRMGVFFQGLIQWLDIPGRPARIHGTSGSSFWVPSSTKQCRVSVCQNCGESFRTKTWLQMCPTCSSAAIDEVEGVEIGDVATSGSILTAALGVYGSDQAPSHLAVMGIGMSRILQLLAEHHHDDRGIVWPVQLAPFRYHLVTTEVGYELASATYDHLQRSGSRVLFDARRLPIGRSLIDADLVGLPYRLLFGGKAHPGKIEVSVRKTGDRFAVFPAELHSALQSLP